MLLHLYDVANRQTNLQKPTVQVDLYMQKPYFFEIAD